MLPMMKLHTKSSTYVTLFLFSCSLFDRLPLGLRWGGISTRVGLLDERRLLLDRGPLSADGAEQGRRVGDGIVTNAVAHVAVDVPSPRRDGDGPRPHERAGYDGRACCRTSATRAYAERPRLWCQVVEVSRHLHLLVGDDGVAIGVELLGHLLDTAELVELHFVVLPGTGIVEIQSGLGKAPVDCLGVGGLDLLLLLDKVAVLRCCEVSERVRED